MLLGTVCGGQLDGLVSRKQHRFFAFLLAVVRDRSSVSHASLTSESSLGRVAPGSVSSFCSC